MSHRPEITNVTQTLNRCRKNASHKLKITKVTDQILWVQGYHDKELIVVVIKLYNMLRKKEEAL
jgi:hypothetical protein